jgi:SAM-dependent methyltransferase
VHIPRIARVAGVDEGDVEERYKTIAAADSIEDVLRRAGIWYRAPADAAATGLPRASVDALFSNSVFEHVPRQTILALLREAHRVLRPSGVTIHSVNCGDHYAYFDRSITPLNYLQYTDRQWKFWNNPLQFQNRLRPQDFLDLAREGGLSVTMCQYRAKDGLLAILPSLQVAPQFAGYAPEQLCATSVTFAARREPGPDDAA